MDTVDPGTGLLRTRGGPRVDHPADCKFCLLGYPIDDRAPEHHINPETHVWPIAEWGSECGRGFVSHEMFNRGNDRVIPRTPRTLTRKWRKLEETNKGPLRL